MDVEIDVRVDYELEMMIAWNVWSLLLKCSIYVVASVPSSFSLRRSFKISLVVKLCKIMKSRPELTN